MEHYLNLDGTSGIDAYEAGDQYIIVHFKHGDYNLYTYSYDSTGESIVVRMKTLAREGRGLHTFIKENDPPYLCKGCV